jgi:hypothetical protein
LNIIVKKLSITSFVTTIIVVLSSGFGLGSD